MSRRPRIPLASAALLILASALYGLIVDQDAGVAFVVIAIGTGGIALAIAGKPTWTGAGQTERLLARLPEPLWRAATGLIGLVVAAVGVSHLMG